MKITPKDTVNDIVMRNRALFSMGTERIVKAIQDLPEPEFVPMKRRMWLFSEKTVFRRSTLPGSRWAS